jgi:hypothetical protein
MRGLCTYMEQTSESVAAAWRNVPQEPQLHLQEWDLENRGIFLRLPRYTRDENLKTFLLWLCWMWQWESGLLLDTKGFLTPRDVGTLALLMKTMCI